MRDVITLCRMLKRIGFTVKLAFLTSKSIAKVISFLIISVFICVQFAWASHSHEDNDSAPEPSPCVMCLAAAEPEEVDFDSPPTPPMPFIVPNTLDFDLTILFDARFTINRDDMKRIEPPNLRPSAPRAPPV